MKRKNKRFISSILSLVFIISTLTVSAKDYTDYPQKFWDVSKDHWAYTYISELTDKNVIAGYEDGSFKPENTVSRKEWSKMMVLSSGISLSSEDYNITDLPSTDWAYNYVVSVKNYMNWYVVNNSIYFRGNQAASREDVTVSLVKLKGYSVDDVDYSVLSKFKDTDSISNDLKKYVAVAIQKNLISGFEDNTFRGQDTLTRAEASILLCKAFQMGNDNKVVDFDEANNTIGTGVSDTSYIDMFKETPTPEPTSEPTVEPTAEPIIEPTAEPVVSEPIYDNNENNSYSVDTLLNAKISSPDYYSYHDNELGIMDEYNILHVYNLNSMDSVSYVDFNNFRVMCEGEESEDYHISNIKQLFYSEYHKSWMVYADIAVDGDLIHEGKSKGNVIVNLKTHDAFTFPAKMEAKDEYGDTFYYTINKFIGSTTNGLLCSYKSSLRSYYHVMLSAPDFQKATVLEPIYVDDYLWVGYQGYEYMGYDGSNLTTFTEQDNNLYFATANRLYRYNYRFFEEAATISEANASFVNKNGFYALTDENLIKATYYGYLDYSVSVNDIEINDGKQLSFKNVMPIFIVAYNGDFIFYDTSYECFRIVHKLDYGEF